MATEPPIIVCFIEPDATERRVPALPGQNLMDAALAAGVAGIIGQCGGAINCATCLCDLLPAEPRQSDETSPRERPTLPEPHPDETELLSYVAEASTQSRLACQLIATPELNGLVLRGVSPGNCV